MPTLAPMPSGNCPLVRLLCFYTEPDSNVTPEYIEETSVSPGQRNYPHTKRLMPITDIRGLEAHFNLSEHSFCAVPRAFTSEINFELAADITEKYLPWVKQFIISHVQGSIKVVIFDHCIRKASCMKTSHRQVRKIHIDQSPAGAYARVKRHLSESDLRGINTENAYFKIVNVWKPVSQPVTDHPLTFAEFKSLEADDLIPVRQTYPTYTGETYAVKYNPNHQFRYWSNMDTSDVLLLQCFDSKRGSGDDGKPNYVQCAHGSFELDESGDEPYERKSIEVRCIVICQFV
ncbi:hypothetical protein QQS21_004243 [Conoideocrella luteorostrata]|uniref:Uncharacterized protein n=1 Tax=Conoideocrella luteorostrata TaxID=1105319 RepID=A0AAJ0CRW5_9HYPO|nr:hypothetical protein QQS21_004243 [Conoideocrella luteorostrata]